MSAADRAALVLAAAAAAMVAVVAAQTPAAPQFAARSDAVLVDVRVTRGGRAVTDLTAADFTVRDAGVVQQVALVDTAGLPVSLLLVLDASASVRGAPLDHLKDAARAVVAALRPADRAALLTFSHVLQRRTGWTASIDALRQAIDAVSGQGFTALHDAVMAAIAMPPPRGTRGLVLVFTDGDDTSSWTSAADLLQAARRSDATVYAVTVDSPGHSGAAMARLFERPASDAARADLERRLHAEPRLYRGAVLPLLTSLTGGEALRAADTTRLREAFLEILLRFSQRYVLAYTPTGVSPAGWHPLEVEVKGGGEVSARRGYVR